MSYDLDYAAGGGPESPNWHKDLALVTDAVSNSGPSYDQDSTFWNVETNCGWLTTSQDLLAVFSGR
jgi:hypothetical protein